MMLIGGLTSIVSSLSRRWTFHARCAAIPIPEPIAINNESDFHSEVTAGGCYGSGSSADPYVLENKTLTWNGAGPAVLVANVTSHFVIRNLTLIGTPNYDLMSYSYGIQLYNVSNGQIDRCTISNFTKDVKIGTDGPNGASNSIVISNCSISGPATNNGIIGIDLSYTTGAVVDNNLVTGCNYGLYLFNANDAIVRFNNISFNYGYGLWMSSSSAHNVFSGNLVASNGLGGLGGAVMSVEGSNNLFYGNAFVSSSTGNYIQINVMSSNHNTWNSTQGLGNYWGNQYNQNLGGNESFIGHSVDWNGQVLQQHAINLDNIDHHPCRYIIDAPVINQPVTTLGEATISWSAPSYNLGPTISSYVIVRSDGMRSSVAGDVSSFTDSFVGEWASYSYSVQAKSAWGTGGVNVSVAAQNPARPSLVITSALNASMNGGWVAGSDPYSISPKNVVVQWSGYDSNSALPGHGLPHYWVALDNGTWIDVGTSTNYTFDKIVEGKHAVQVKGQDADGNIVIVEKHFSVFRILVVTMDLSSIKTTLGSEVTASVLVVDFATGAPLSQVAVDFFQSVDSGMSYGSSKFSTASTDNDGKATTSFIPAATSNYVIQARAYMGNIMRQYYANVSLTVSPYEGKNAFSVQSTSTVTDLSFDSNAKVLKFTFSGESGTTGTTKVSIAKSLVTDGNSINVSLDQNTIAYTVSEIGDYWVLTFTYHHSSHAIAVGVPTFGTSGSVSSLGIDPILTVGVVAVVVVAIAAVFAVRRRKV